MRMDFRTLRYEMNTRFTTMHKDKSLQFRELHPHGGFSHGGGSSYVCPSGSNVPPTAFVDGHDVD
ncbi:hypothetical protein Dimus_005771, partial [Dionaea muscipula]